MSERQTGDVHYHIHYHEGRRHKRRRHKRGRNAQCQIVSATPLAPVRDDAIAPVSPLGLPTDANEPSGTRLSLPDSRTEALVTPTASPVRSNAAVDRMTVPWSSHAVVLICTLSIGFVGWWPVAAAVLTVYAIGMIGVAMGEGGR